MNEIFEKKKETIALLKQKNPSYAEILTFYEKILEEQESAMPHLDIPAIEIRKELRTLQAKEGFPLMDKGDFIIDVSSSLKLFESICHISKNTNEKMRENVQVIEEALTINALNFKELLKKHSDEFYLNAVAEEFDIDIAILKFLIHMSIQPSLKTNVERLKGQVELQNWLRGYCPICGSAPQMSGLRGEGQRFLQCSFCSFQWPAERLRCPFCGNRDQEKLRYFYAEKQEQYRVDLCDNCKQYIKTVDTRKIDYEPDLNLEDITTIHLDILASEKGFKKPVPSYWGL